MCQGVDETERRRKQQLLGNDGCFLLERAVQFMRASTELRGPQLCLLLFSECAALCHRMSDFGSQSFSKEEGLFLAFYAYKDKKGLGQPLSLSQECSAIWEVST